MYKFFFVIFLFLFLFNCKTTQKMQTEITSRHTNTDKTEQEIEYDALVDNINHDKNLLNNLINSYHWSTVGNR